MRSVLVGRILSKRGLAAAVAGGMDRKVDRARIELATHGFSGRCSTD